MTVVSDANGDLDAPAELDERLVDAADLVEELDRDQFPFDPDRIGRTELASSEAARFAERFFDKPPSTISHNTACNRQIARVRAAVS